MEKLKEAVGGMVSALGMGLLLWGLVWLSTWEPGPIATGALVVLVAPVLIAAALGSLPFLYFLGGFIVGAVLDNWLGTGYFAPVLGFGWLFVAGTIAIGGRVGGSAGGGGDHEIPGDPGDW